MSYLLIDGGHGMTRGTSCQVFQFRDPESFRRFLGPQRSNIQTLRQYGIQVQVRAYRVLLHGNPGQEFNEARAMITKMKQQAEGDQPRSTMSKPARARRESSNTYKGKKPDFVVTPPMAKVHVMIQPKNQRQRDYMDAIRSNDMVFGLGPAGTGKTFIAVAQALKALEHDDVKRIIITRPAVEAGEKLGFLPGSFADKVDPYLQPIYDALNILAGKPYIEAMRRDGRIEIAPLAFMRGRTLNDAFILLDEAQNCTWTQLVMLMTRMGEHSKCVITGDASQTDLLRGQSGLSNIVNALGKVEGIEVFSFGPEDVVRHPLVSRIVNALDAYQDGHQD